MPALITTLLLQADNVAVVRDQIGALLALEVANQKVLAAAASQNPALWNLKVFTDRTNPWSDFVDAPAAATPLVNITFDNWTADQSMGNTVSRQAVLGTFNLDCYGYGKSANKASGGHVAGDELAEKECLRAAALVRQIIMSGQYTYLGLQGLVGRRWPASLTVTEPHTGEHALQHVRVARLALQVQFNEFSPQNKGVPLVLLSMRVKRSETGQLLLRADYPQ